MKITFHVNYNTHWGENIFICGSTKQLGNWESLTALPMTYQGQGDWVAICELNKSESFEYKYILKSKSSIYIWEGGSNRKFNPLKKTTFEVRDFWHPISDPNISLYSKVFTSVLMKPDNITNKKAIPSTKPTILFSLSEPRVEKGSTIAIIGNQKALGNWNNPVLMSNFNYPEWEIELDLSKISFPIWYKYVVVKQKTGEINLWEEGDPRQITHIDIDQKKYMFAQNDENFRYKEKHWRGAGVAVPVFSLRSEESFGVGEFNDLKKLVDWSVKTGMKIIQILPINETVATHSWLDSYPYKAISTIALHPMYLNLQSLGILNDERLRDEFDLLHDMLNSKPYVDYVQVTRLKSKYYKLIFDQEWKKISKTDEYKFFFDQNKEWLKPYAAFCYLRDRYKTGNFRNWDEWAKFDPIKINKLVSPDTNYFEHIAVHYFIQFHLDKQLKSAVNYAHSNGVALKGDIPIGISPNSIEAWTEPENFNLNGQAGAPPDDFAILGQNWGFPTYNWDTMASDGFSWWKKRLSAMSKYFDAYRIDHILGFFRIWEIPKDAIHGLLGYFKPALPLTSNDIQEWGIWFDFERFVKPHIPLYLIQTYFGEHTIEVLSLYLSKNEKGFYELNEGYRTQKEIYYHFTPIESSQQIISEKNTIIRDGLLALLNEVLFIEDPYAKPKAYHPRIAMHLSNTYIELDQELKENLNKLYIDYYYRRHDQFWKEEALRKLPAIIAASNMLVCGEDLGMVPDNVPEVMKELNILSLEIQRMPKNPDIEFGHPKDAPYLSVCTTSTHDMSTLRGWWEENREKTQRYYKHILGHNNIAPDFAEPLICLDIIDQHLRSPAMWTIFPIQDLIASNGELRSEIANNERINVPSNDKNKWKYRMMISLEDLIKAVNFNRSIMELIKQSGRL